MTASPIRLPGQGRAFPAWLDTRDPEALRGTSRLRTIDPNLTVGLNLQTRAYEVWGPSIHFRGWVPICVCQDEQGRPWRGTVPWDRVIASLIQAREGELAPDVAAAHNEKIQRDVDDRERARVREGVKYYRKAVQGELEGYGRHRDQDVADGWRSANESAKPQPRGRVISIARG